MKIEFRAEPQLDQRLNSLHEFFFAVLGWIAQVGTNIAIQNSASDCLDCADYFLN
jgi:hypothetical protein